MKILFINKYDTLGGAAISALRIGCELQKIQNFDVKFLVGEKSSDIDFVHATRRNKIIGFIEKLINLGFNIIGLQYHFLPFSARVMKKFVTDYNPDIIFLNNIHGGYFQLNLLEFLSNHAPLVWLLHDMWSFTGSSAYTDFDEWKRLKSNKIEMKDFPKIYSNTGEYLLKRKKKIYSKLNLTIVTPSTWMFNCANESPLFKNFSIKLIPYSIDLDIYKPSDKSIAKSILGFDPEEIVISFGAEKLTDFRKGGDIIFDIIKKLNDESDMRLSFLTFGNVNPTFEKFKNIKTIQMGYLNSDKEKVLFYNASDVLIFPTRADNLPLVPIESISCGTPVIISKAGGCSDIIKNEYNGYVIENENPSSYIQKLLPLVKSKKLLDTFSNNSREYAIKTYSPKLITSQYVSLINELTLQRNND